jgi:hypothetical protein
MTRSTFRGQAYRQTPPAAEILMREVRQDYYCAVADSGARHVVWAMHWLYLKSNQPFSYERPQGVFADLFGLILSLGALMNMFKPAVPVFAAGRDAMDGHQAEVWITNRNTAQQGHGRLDQTWLGV